MDISKLIQGLIAKSPGVKYDPNSSGAIKTELLHQEIKKNGIMFKKSVEYLAHCLKAYDIETIQRKKHNMLEINLAIASISRYKSRFFMLLAVEAVFNEFFQEIELNATEINIKDLNIKGLMRLSKRGSSKTLKLKNGGAGSRRTKNKEFMTKKITKLPREKKNQFSMINFLLMLMYFITFISASGIKPENQVGLYMNTPANDLQSVMSHFARVSVGIPYPTKGSENVNVFTPLPQIEGPTIIDPTYSDVKIPYTVYKFSDVERTLVGAVLWVATAVTPSTQEEKEFNKLRSMTTIINDFNDISAKISKKVTDACAGLLKEIKLSNIFTGKEILNLANPIVIPGETTADFFGRKTTGDPTIKYNNFTSADLTRYIENLCSTPEILLAEPSLNDDRITYTITLERFGIPHSEALLTNLTIATGQHLSDLIRESEKAYQQEMNAKGSTIETDYSLSTKDSIRRAELLNLQEKISLYKILIDTIVSEQKSLSNMFSRINLKKKSGEIDITTPTALLKLLDSIQEENEKILKNVDSTLISEEYTTPTPFTLKERKKMETFAKANKETAEQVARLSKENWERLQRLREEDQEQKDSNRNYTQQSDLNRQHDISDMVSRYVNDMYSYGKGIIRPMYENTGDFLNVSSEGLKKVIKGTGGLLGGGIGAIVGGFCEELFGDWGWTIALIFFAAVPTMASIYIAWQIGGIQLAIRLVKGGVNLGFGLVTYLPRKILIAIFSRGSNGAIASQGIITTPNPQNQIPGSRNLPMLGAPTPGITEISSSEARRINNPEDAERNISRRRLEREDEARAAEARAAESRAAEANRNETATDVARKAAATAEARSRADYLKEQSRLRNLQTTEVGGRRYRKRTYKRKHNKRNRRSRRK